MGKGTQIKKAIYCGAQKTRGMVGMRHGGLGSPLQCFKVGQQGVTEEAWSSSIWDLHG